jgi:class 3 adenylate cyclase
VPRLVVDWLRHAPERKHRRLEATLVFVDISGFTRLTERLSRRGKVGAEEMNDILDSCFTELLSVAYDYGAGVIKWGGDAVLLLFDGDAHPVRACRASAEMQATMRTIGRLRLPAGSVTLRMSVGVQTGAFDFFLVGGLHRELVVAGPLATETVALESVAEAGEVVVSKDTAAALHTACVGPPRGHGFLLRRAPEIGSQRSPPVGDVSDVDLSQCLPIEICEHLAAGGGEPEHRLMTAAFVQVMGADGVLTSDGPDALAAALEQAVATVQRLAHEHRVSFFETDVAGDGLKIMLMAGAPTATGNDEERMLRAMRAAIDARPPLPMRIGTTWGRIFVGDFGPSYRRTYSVKGDAVNLAARLTARAEPGQLLATADVLERSRTTFDTRALAPFAAKGKSKPVVAFVVGRPVGTRERGVQTPFVGRSRELELLDEALASARAGSGRVVELVGAGGMGKSRLIEEFRARVEDVDVVQAHGEEYERATPYFGFGALLRSALRMPSPDEESIRLVVAETAPRLAPWLPLLGVPLGLAIAETPETAALDERFRKEKLEEVVVELLDAVLASPALVVFEDVHWLDDASADLLRRVVGRAVVRPWLIVVARREEPGDFEVPDEVGPLSLRLEPLDAEDAAPEATRSSSPSCSPPQRRRTGWKSCRTRWRPC